MKRAIQIVCVVVILSLGSAAMAVDIETVPVGNPGNAAELSGAGAGGFGPDRICGAVAYEYNIGKYEVTAGQYTEFLNAVAKTDTYGLYNTDMSYGYNGYGCRIMRDGSSGSYGYDVAADWADRPVNYVSWGDAARFANWLHNGRPSGEQDSNTTEDGAYYLNGATSDAALLPAAREDDWKWAITSEDEWYKAAYYNPATSSYYDYPAGSDTAPGYVNNGGNLSGTGNPFVEGGSDPGNYATYDDDYGIDGIGSPYYRTEVGEWENSESPYGTFDQGGNVWEWNEAIIGSERGMLGGSFISSDGALHASNRNVAQVPTLELHNLGFRVSEVPEPATLSLLTLGGLAILRRQKTRIDS